MLRNVKDLENYTISATDGPIGQVKDFYFDDDTWAVRYLVVDTGSWLESRRVLISPISVQRPDWQDHTLPVSITKQQVQNSPGIDTHMPVSRQNEEQMLGYYGYANYWGGGGLWGEGLYPYEMVPGFAGHGLDRAARIRELEAYLLAEKARQRSADPHLRSCNALIGYDIHASDGAIGHVAGFLVDDATWALRYLVIDTSNWWVGHKVLIAPPWIKGVHWSDRSVEVDLSREQIKTAPIFESTQAWSRHHDVLLYRHYRRHGDWADDAAA